MIVTMLSAGALFLADSFSPKVEKANSTHRANARYAAGLVAEHFSSSISEMIGGAQRGFKEYSQPDRSYDGGGNSGGGCKAAGNCDTDSN